ncbi:MAG: hypothetical protein IPM26_10370 [Saprospiraceae bacterium]|nr:hypothetical protein [Saprospiraceae bacterium]
MKHRFFFYILILALSIAVLNSACNNNEKLMSPKPRMYPRIYYPQGDSLKLYSSDYCPFTFEYPEYMVIKKDSFVFDGKPPGDCWFDINSPDLNTSLHCSYYPINRQVSLSQLINDAFTITGKHNIKASYRKESFIRNEYGVSGLMFEVEGPVASPVQFYLTDSTSHFFRASFYFNSTVNPDSTAEVLQFIRKDIDKIISSFRWKK